MTSCGPGPAASQGRGYGASIAASSPRPWKPREGFSLIAVALTGFVVQGYCALRSAIEKSLDTEVLKFLQEKERNAAYVRRPADERGQ